jgi:hypothetical protein
MTWTDEDESCAGLGEKRGKLAKASVDGLAHEILDAIPRLEAFFLPSACNDRGKDDHGPMRMTVAAEWVRVWVRVTSERVTPRA